MSATDSRVSERQLLRDSVRSLLNEHWPVDGAVERGQERGPVDAIWKQLAEHGLANLGTDPEEAGMREMLLVLNELGRASCPAPLLGGVAANYAFGSARNASPSTRELLDAVHCGSAAIAFSLGAFDGDAAAGRAEYADGIATGRVAFVEGALSATHYLVLIDSPAGVAIVCADAAGLTVTATPGLAVPSLSEIVFDSCEATFVELPRQRLTDVALIMRMACGARAMGAAQRAFDLALEHVVVRRQFGQFIGQFQAIQHKLADCLTALDGARLLLENAANAYDVDNPSWHVFASAALAFAGPALRQVVLEAIHALGAIGCAEEHEAPRHFRRVHADLVRFGGAPRARAEVAEYLLGTID